MSATANTRLFKGSVLKVDDLAASTIDTGELTKVTGLGGAPAGEIPVSTAASTIDETRLGLPEPGDVTFDFFLDMDDNFQQEMETMRDAQETRTFKLVLPEGTKKVATFSASVIDSSITGSYNSVYTMSLVLSVTSAVVWAAT